MARISYKTKYAKALISLSKAQKEAAELKERLEAAQTELYLSRADARKLKVLTSFFENPDTEDRIWLFKEGLYAPGSGLRIGSWYRWDRVLKTFQFTPDQPDVVSKLRRLVWRLRKKIYSGNFTSQKKDPRPYILDLSDDDSHNYGRVLEI